MHMSKRQTYVFPGSMNTSEGFYYKEWAIFAAIVASIILTITLIRISGRRRIRNNRPLAIWQKFFFPRALRHGPPYDAPVPLNPYVPHHRFGQVTTMGVTAPPPSYDPYATNLPAYQAKAQEEVGTSEVPSHHDDRAPIDMAQLEGQRHGDVRQVQDQYRYMIPENIARR